MAPCLQGVTDNDVGGDHSCVVSGESGAGKTVSANNIMKYLAKLSNYRKMAKGTYVEPKKGLSHQLLL